MTEAFRDHLQNLMRVRGFSQRSLAAQSGVDHSTISKYLKGDTNAVAKCSVRLAEVLVEPEYAAEFHLLAVGFPRDVVEAATGKPIRTYAEIGDQYDGRLARLRSINGGLPSNGDRIARVPAGKVRRVPRFT